MCINGRYLGFVTSQCHCSRDMVRINMDCFVKRLQPEKFDKWKNGEDGALHPEDDTGKKLSNKTISESVHRMFSPIILLLYIHYSITHYSLLHYVRI